MASALRSFRPMALARVAPRPVAHPVSFRAFSVSASRRAGGHGPPQLLGPGAKAGEATGLERFELLGKLEGVDVFDMKPLEMTRLGTVEDPIKIYSLFPERQVGCTGFPADSHDTLWLTVTHKLKHHRCPECGCVYEMNFQGDPAVLEEGHGHHH